MNAKFFVTCKKCGWNIHEKLGYFQERNQDIWLLKCTQCQDEFIISRVTINEIIKRVKKDPEIFSFDNVIPFKIPSLKE